ncbi:DNA polymerase III subunit gamma/tau [Conservatibacter flavescens]|uniref:DNA polymerase III subunit gamma/tau n=1 Tax=Conservatibacter flavescens TaxID=28161 RepID=A0A2M8S638_9PAST|nr:DNA polymerase III subunit gamma/tau [Conservatibacter flavescens]PJG86600.1 DNA polymerase III subunit gamma/tau [Conservatibacter flavescens]
MSYQVLARKWRPKTFTEVVGQEHILTALSNGLKENRLHHAYLFSGTRGVGKTSIARLFAKGLNCINGITADPCGKCEHCKAIEEGHFIDLIEIDAASRTKVEDTRELLDNVQYKPVQGRYKVYLIDEVHMLSRHSFNALLKTLEEPPEYVKFLLATTDPQKLPITILSRCIQFHLKALEQEQISNHLEHILTLEKIPFELTALSKLAKASQGSIRDSLSLTDQAIAMGEGKVSADVVNDMLGLLDDNQGLDIIRALHQGNGDAMMKTVQAVARKGVDWEQLLIEVAELLHQIAMCQLLTANPLDESPVAFLAKQLSPEDVQFYYQVMVMGRKELALAPDRRTGVEMTLLRALAFHPKIMAQAEQNRPVETTSQKSAVENHEKLSTIPVVSSAKIQAQATIQSTPGVASLQQLRNIQSGNQEKKNANAELASSSGVAELPVISSAQSQQKLDLIAKVSNLAAQNQRKTEPSLSSQNRDFKAPAEQYTDENQTDDENDEAVTYRWEWINPEMANVEQGIRPSEIKQAILQEKTQELIDKVVNLAAERDPWAKIIEDFKPERFVKQLALHSVLLAQSETQIKLGVRSKQAHLNKPKNVQELEKGLSDFYQQAKQVEVVVFDEIDQLTPMEHRQQIYHELQVQAKHDLLEDEKIKLLQREFNAELSLESIRPV